MQKQTQREQLNELAYAVAVHKQKAQARIHLLPKGFMENIMQLEEKIERISREIRKR